MGSQNQEQADPVVAQRGTFTLPGAEEVRPERVGYVASFGMRAVPVEDSHAFVTNGVRGALFDLTTGRARWTIVSIPRTGWHTFYDKTFGMAFSKEANLVAASSGGSVYLWDVGSGETSQIVDCQSDGELVFSPDGSALQTYSDSDSAVHIWDAASGRELLRLKGELAGGRCLPFSPDGRFVASTRTWYEKRGPQWWLPPRRLRPSIVRLVEVATGEELWRLDGHEATCFSPDGMILATEPEVCDSSEVHLWDVREYREVCRLRFEKYRVRPYVFSPDSRTVATTVNNVTFRLCDVRTGVELQSSAWPHWLRCLLLAFGPYGRYLAYVSKDWGPKEWTCRELCLRDMITGQELCLPESYEPIWGGFSADGRTALAVCSRDCPPGPRGIALWDTATGRLLSRLDLNR